MMMIYSLTGAQDCRTALWCMNIFLLKHLLIKVSKGKQSIMFTQVSRLNSWCV